MLKAYELLYWNFISRLKLFRPDKSSKNKELNIILNGPSCTEYFENMENGNIKGDFMCVNHFASQKNELFRKLRPKYYVFIDPTIAGRGYSNYHEITGKTVEAIADINWDMEMIMNPMGYKEFANSNIKTSFISPVEIFSDKVFFNELYLNNVCSLSLKNVAVCAIMSGIIRNYEKINLYGLDMNYLLDLYVDENNHLFRIPNKHSYKEDNLRPFDISNSYAKVSMIWDDYARIYKSFYKLQDLATLKNIKIINKNKNSLIDAFEKLGEC